MLRAFIGVVGVSSLLVLAPLSTAGAADMPVKAPPPPPAPVANWTGCYLNVGVGYGLLDDERGVRDPDPIRPNSTSAAKGWLGAFGGGCDYQFSSGGPWGPIVIGAFADYDLMNITGSYGDPSNAGQSGTQTLTDAVYVGARAGVLVTPGLLAYIDGGWTGGRINAIPLAPLGGCAGTCFDTLPAVNTSGGFIGGGYEYALPWLFNGLYWRTEYRYAFYENFDQHYIHPTFIGSRIVSNSVDVQTITSSLVWRFNWMH